MNALLRHIRVVAFKELLDGIRDRRSLVSALLFPLFGPVLIAGMFTMIAKEQSDDRPVSVAVVGAEYAPALVEHLERSGIDIEPDPPAAEVLEDEVEAGERDVAMIIDEDFPRMFRQGRPAPVSLVVDTSRRESRTPIRKVERALEAYSGKVGTLRLLARGVDPQLVKAVAVERLDTSTSARHAANLMMMVPMFVMLAAFVGGMFIATDSTAGERERRSMEPLLLAPVARSALVIGKWLAATVFAATAMILTLAGSLIAMHQVPFEDLGVVLNVGWVEGVILGVGLVPLAFFATGIQLLVASFAKSFREAQTYLSLQTLVPTLPAAVLSIKPMSMEAWMMVVPVLGQQTVVLELLRGEVVPWGYVAITAVVAIVMGAVAVAATAKLFASERLV